MKESSRRVIAVTNIKGGIGKTTTVVNIGAGMALKGARVLLVDVDAQGNLAMCLGMHPKYTLYDALVDGKDATKCIVHARPNLDLLAADDTLLGAQPILSQRADWGRVLQHVLSPLKRQYDFIFIDSPGSLTLFSVNALMAASDIIIPTTVEHLSIKGLSLLFKQIARTTARSDNVRMIIPTMFDSRMRQSQELLSYLHATYGGLVTAPIRVNVRISEASALGKTIYEHDVRSRGSLDYAHLVNRLGDMCGFQPAPKASPANQQHHNGQNHCPYEQNGSPSAGLAEPVTGATIAMKKKPQPQATANKSLPFSCPNCGRILRRTTVAGYRVVYCDTCKYKQQELAAMLRS